MIMMMTYSEVPFWTKSILIIIIVGIIIVVVAAASAILFIYFYSEKACQAPNQ